MSTEHQQSLQYAQIEWSEQNNPLCLRHGDIYFSKQNGIEESRYVFLTANNLPERWGSIQNQPYVIAETGFGTGLNFLSTWQTWQQSAQKNARLHYISTEKYPLSKNDLQRSLSVWPELADVAEEFIGNYPILTAGPHRLILAGGSVILDLLLGDAQQQLQQYWDDHSAKQKNLAVNSWYLDGFSPNKNPDMWTLELFEQIARMSSSNTQFSTFTAAGDIRRKLEQCGFTVEKIKGYGNKREMLRGNFDDRKDSTTNSQWPVPWHLGSPHFGSRHQADQAHAIVVGAGLAGCTSAEALIRRGWDITLIEQHNVVANEASGNNQGILYTRLSHQMSTLSEFTLQSYLFSLRYYKNKFLSKNLQDGIDGALCGALHLHSKPSHTLHPQLQHLLDRVEDLAQSLTEAEAKTVAGIAAVGAGLFFPGAGWISPASLCQEISQQAGIKLITGTGPVSIQFLDDHWQVFAEDGTLIDHSPTLIIASGTSSNTFEQLNWLPLQKIRGQTSELMANEYSDKLQTVLCHEGYIAPAKNGKHCMGATFDIGDDCQHLRDEDHNKNLEQLTQAAPELGKSLGENALNSIDGRVGFRCASPDYLPLVGNAPKPSDFDQRYATLRKDAGKNIDCEGSYYPGLFVNTGHGSRGLTSSPWCAEFLASLICNEPLPTSKKITRSLLPARFLIRDLIRNKR